jgi:DNA-binding NarL/FixJ family response regulator
MDNEVNILVVDDHEAIGKGLISLGDDCEKLNFIGQCKTGNEAMEFLKTNETDVIIMDISLKKENGIVLTKDILEKYPKIKIIIYSFHEDLASIQEAMHAGAKGYFSKGGDSEEFMKALENFDENKFTTSAELSKLLIDNQKEIMLGRGKFFEEVDTQIIKLFAEKNLKK